MEKYAEDGNAAKGKAFQLKAIARRVEPRVSWEDLTLPHAKLSQLRDICNQARETHRISHEWGFDRRLSHGKGLSVLFSGPPGSGKTMAAKVIASDLEKSFFRIDLSAVVSKYIGETEKNLRELFFSAEASNAILFFDEADALFGKRTQLSDAPDHYTNIETGYLLQMMEEYTGIAILATNLRQSPDTEFIRRIRHIVEFPVPDENSRDNQWDVEFPRKKPWDIVWRWFRRVLRKA